MTGLGDGQIERNSTPIPGALPYAMDTGTILTSVIGASAATIAVVIAKDAKISEFRQEWINSLRDDVSRECAVLHSLHAFVRRLEVRKNQPELDGGVTKDTERDERAAYFANGLEANQLSARITLRLDMKAQKNPKKEAKKRKHRELNKLVVEAHPLASNVEVSFNDLCAHMDKIEVATSEVLDEAWERVKRGETRYQAVLWFAVTALVLSVSYAGWSSYHLSQQRPTLDIMVTKPIQVEEGTVSAPLSSSQRVQVAPPVPSNLGSKSQSR